MKPAFIAGSCSLVHHHDMTPRITGPRRVVARRTDGTRPRSAAAVVSAAASSPAPALDERALRAHVLRRLSFGPRPWQVEDLDGTSATDLIEQLLAAEPFWPDDPALGSDDDYSRLPAWWLDVMSDERAGLHDRMVWFWHGHLTSGLDKSSPSLMYRQHQLLRTHAMGNFRSMLQEVTVDAAMLYWLDGAGSYADSPNENYAREVMELFALGHGAGYTEDDVRNGAGALAGWWVDGDNDDKVRFDQDSALSEPVPFLDRQVMTAAEAIDAVCDHPSCAPHVAGSVHEHLTGAWPDEARLAELAGVFTSSGLEIRPLVEAIVRHPSFLDQRLNRPRSAVEWFIAVRRLFDVQIEWWPLDLLGQIPFSPPNVAGWPGASRWLSVGAEMTKAQVAYDNAWETATLDEGDPVADLLGRAGMYEVSQSTIDVLSSAVGSLESRRDRSTLLHGLLAMSPEFSLA